MSRNICLVVGQVFSAGQFRRHDTVDFVVRTQRFRPLHAVDCSRGPVSSTIRLNERLEPYCCLVTGSERFDMHYVFLEADGDGGVFGIHFGLLDLLANC